ncbi:MAG: MipA/OmpV family protein [Pseudomonadota bacterium]
MMMPRLSLLLLSLLSCSAYAADEAALTSGRASELAATTKQAEIGIGVVGGTSIFGGDAKGAILNGEASFGNGIFVSTQDGLGFRFPATSSGFSAAISIGASGGRRAPNSDERLDSRLHGMGDVSSYAQLRGFLNYDNGPYHAEAQLRQTLAGRNETSIGLGAKYDIFASSTDLVQAATSVGFANRKEMQTYFGVTAAQSASSGNAVYAPGAGLEGVSAGVNWRHVLAKDWVATVGAGATVLGNQAADSSLVARRTSLGVGTSIAYRF